jgi:hypothetical protein
MKRKHPTRAQLIRNTLRSLMQSLKTAAKGRVVSAALPRPPKTRTKARCGPARGKCAAERDRRHDG